MHQFQRPAIRLWLPVLMLSLLLLCGWLAARRVRAFEMIALALMVYVVISAVVSVAEIAVTPDGLLIDRLLLPMRFIPWEAVERVVVYARSTGQVDAHIEITTIGVQKGLSPLNRLPGLLYGLGMLQTIIITPETVTGYDTLMAELEGHTYVVWR